jgi:hypothetical protein
MSKRHLHTALAVLLVTTPALAAQQSRTNATPTNAAPDAITIKGCVVESMGRYMLNDALVTKPTPNAVPSAQAAPAAKSGSDDQIYELIGAQVKAHVGHQVEVVGTMPPSGANGNAQKAQDPKQTAHPMAGTVNVKKVTMLASTCR